MITEMTNHNYLSPVHPGEILKEDFLKPLNITPYELAEETFIDVVTIFKIILGKCPITADIAIGLGIFFDMSPQFWINAQAHYDLEMAKKENQNSNSSMAAKSMYSEKFKDLLETLSSPALQDYYKTILEETTSPAVIVRHLVAELNTAYELLRKSRLENAELKAELEQAKKVIATLEEANKDLKEAAENFKTAAELAVSAGKELLAENKNLTDKIENKDSGYYSRLINRLNLNSEYGISILIYILQDFVLNPHKKPFNAKDSALKMIEELTKYLP